MMHLDDSTRNQIILAAVAASGDPADAGWQARVTANATRIAALLDEHSEPAKAVESIAASKVFVGTVVSVKREESSTRGIVTLRTQPSDFHADGIERVRTPRTDDPAGLALALARRVQRLRGHRVKVFVEVETVSAGGKKVRVLRHVEDLGPAEFAGEQANPEVTPKQPATAA